MRGIGFDRRNWDWMGEIIIRWEELEFDRRKWDWI